jgi:hypothetical protein
MLKAEKNYLVHEPNMSVLFWVSIAKETTTHDGHTPYSNVGLYRHYQIRAKAMQDIEVVYNREQLHSANNYLSSLDYEMPIKSA